jgi:diaminopimelate dehydrogenase
MDKIKIGIVGYGNIGKAVELAIRQNVDMAPAVILTRRPPQSIRPQRISKNLINRNIYII